MFRQLTRTCRRLVRVALRRGGLQPDRDAADLLMLSGHEDRVDDAVFSPDGRRVITASRDNTARLWDAETGTALAVLRGHEQICDIHEVWKLGAPPQRHLPHGFDSVEPTLVSC